MAKKIQSVDDFMWAMAARACELADMKMDDLRYWAAEGEEGKGFSKYAAKQELLGQSRGKLIEIILTEEFEDIAEDLHQYYEEIFSETETGGL